MCSHFNIGLLLGLELSRCTWQHLGLAALIPQPNSGVNDGFEGEKHDSMAKLGSDKAKTHQTTAYISLGTMDIKIKGTQGRLYVLSVEFCPHSIAYHHRISCSISHFGVSRVSRASTSVSAKETFWRFDRLSPCLMPKLLAIHQISSCRIPNDRTMQNRTSRI